VFPGRPSSTNVGVVNSNAKIRRVARSISPPFLWSALRRVLANSKASGLGALGDLDEILRPYVCFEGGYYVELGANDGLRQSNTLRLERELGWRGLLVEPVVHRYFELVANRSPSNSFACAACVPFDFNERWVEMEYGDLMSMPLGLSHDLPSVDQHRDNAKRHLAEKEHAVVFGARAATLQSLLDLHHAPDVVDFLSLDVEGAELDVLRGIDFSKTGFGLMLIESRSPGNLELFLRDKGYRLINKVTFHDYLFGPET